LKTGRKKEKGRILYDAVVSKKDNKPDNRI